MSGKVITKFEMEVTGLVIIYVWIMPPVSCTVGHNQFSKEFSQKKYFYFTKISKHI